MIGSAARWARPPPDDRQRFDDGVVDGGAAERLDAVERAPHFLGHVRPAGQD